MAKSSLKIDEAPSLCAEPDPNTKDYIMQQTMLRIKDPRKSLEFYSKVMGMRLLLQLDITSMSFSLFFMGYAKAEDIPTDQAERARWAFLQPGCIELTYNYGTDTDDNFKGYHNGNAEPKGFGHIGICVPNVEEACKRFEQHNVEFVKKPNQGKMSGIAFIKDPDGYWIEILSKTLADDIKVIE